MILKIEHVCEDWASRGAIGLNVSFVSANGRIVPKGWPHVDRGDKRSLQASLPLFGTEQALSLVLALLICSFGLTSRSTCIEHERPTFWHKTVNASDHLHEVEDRT